MPWFPPRYCPGAKSLCKAAAERLASPPARLDRCSPDKTGADAFGALPTNAISNCGHLFCGFSGGVAALARRVNLTFCPLTTVHSRAIDRGHLDEMSNPPLDRLNKA